MSNKFDDDLYGDDNDSGRGKKSHRKRERSGQGTWDLLPVEQADLANKRYAPKQNRHRGI